MSSATSNQAAETGRKAPPALVYRSWPLIDEWPRAVVMLVLTAGLAAIAFITTQDWRAAMLVISVMALALWRLWLPTVYEIGPTGIAHRGWRSHRVPWSSIHAWKVHDDGVLLLPDVNASSLGALRGQFMPWGRNRAEVLTLFEHYLGTNKNQA